MILLSGLYLVNASPAHTTPCRTGPSLALTHPSIFCVRSDQYDMQVSVGGLPCNLPANVYIGASYYFCDLPDFDFDPAVKYDLVAYNDAASRTISGLVQYTSAPTLLSVGTCLDQGDLNQLLALGVQCSAGSTLTLRGSHFPAAGTVSVEFYSYIQGDNFSVILLTPTVLNSSVITATLPVLDAATTAEVYGQWGFLHILFGSSGSSADSNTMFTNLYRSIRAPSVDSVSSTMCDSVSPLQLTNCRSMATITILGSNLAVTGQQRLSVSSAGVYQGQNYLQPQTQPNTIWYDSLTNTSLVFTLAYFDGDTNTNLQPDVTYTLVVVASSSLGSGYGPDVSNAFRLSLTYNAVGTATTGRLASGAIAGIVLAAVVVTLLLAFVVVWMVRRCVSGGWTLWWTKHTSAESSSDNYKDVELQ